MGVLGAPVTHISAPEGYFITKNPVTEADIGQQSTGVLEVFIPINIYNKHPRTFHDYNHSGFSNFVGHHARIKQLFGFLANKKWKHGNTESGSAAEDDDDDNGSQAQEEDAAAATYRVGEVRGFNTCVTYERVPHKDNPDVTVGFRLRVIFEQDDLVEVRSQLWRHLNTVGNLNASNLDVGVKNKSELSYNTTKNATTLPLYKRTDVNAYRSSCAYYVGPHVSKGWAAPGTKGVKDGNSVRYGFLDPFKIFTPERSMQLAAAMDAHPDYCDIDNYKNYIHQYACFPNDGVNTYRLWAGQISPASIDKFYLPHIKKPTHTRNPERNLWKQMFQTAGMTEEEINNSYDIHDRTAVLAESHNLDTLKKQISEKRIECKKKFGLNRREFATERRKISLWGLEKLKTIVCKGGDIGDGPQNVAEWADEFLQKRKEEGKVPNFCMPRTKQTTNMSRQADLFISFLGCMETVYGVATVHECILSAWVSGMHMYMPTNGQPHILAPGDPMTGKSFMVDCVQLMLIEGSFRSIAYSTAKALCVAGRKYDMSFEIHEEVVPAFLGIRESAYNGNNQAGTSNGVEECLLKKRMTGGIMSYVRQVRTEAGFVSEEAQVVCNSVLLCCTNAKAREVPKPLLTRFNVMQFQTRQRADGQDITIKFIRPESASLQFKERQLQTRFRRNQYLVMMTMIMVHVGILAPIDKFVANTIFHLVLKKANKRGLPNTTCPRAFQRLGYYVETLVVWDAIDLLYDSEQSPLRNKPHELEDLLLLERHLYSRVEHGVWTLGSNVHNYENAVRANVLQTLQEQFFTDPVTPSTLLAPKPSEEKKNKTNEEQKKERQLLLSWNTSDSFKRVDHLYEAVLVEPKDTITVNQRCRFLAQQLHRHMKIKPPFDEVVAELISMTETLVNTSYKDKNDRLVKVLAAPMLQFENGLIRVPLVSIDKNDATCGVIKQCIKDVLSYKGMRPMNVLYGKTQPDYPSVWQTLILEPRAVGKETEPAKSLRCPVGEHYDKMLVQFANSVLMLDGENDEQARYMLDFDDEQIDHMDLECDIEMFAMETHLGNIELMVEERMSHPSPVSWQVDEDLKKLYLDKEGNCRLPVYPKCILSTDRAEYELARKLHKAANPDLYSATKIMEKRYAYNMSAPLPEDAEDDAMSRASSSSNLSTSAVDEDRHVSKRRRVAAAGGNSSQTAVVAAATAAYSVNTSTFCNDAYIKTSTEEFSLAKKRKAALKRAKLIDKQNKPMTDEQSDSDSDDSSDDDDQSDNMTDITPAAAGGVPLSLHLQTDDDEQFLKDCAQTEVMVDRQKRKRASEEC